MSFKQGKIGFIGLGVMGFPMAKNLLKAGYQLLAFDVDKTKAEELSKEGASIAASSSEVAAGCNGVIFTMLPNSPHVDSVISGENGILQSALEGLIIIDTSSIAPDASKRMYRLALDRGVRYLEAPVSGGEPKAIDGTLSIMAGGDTEIFEQVKELLLIVGSSAIYCGASGSGNTTKLANQMIVALNIAAVSEAFAFVRKSGVDPEKVFEAIKGGLAGSAVLNAKAPMMLEGNYKPGFRIELHIKDLQNALDEAHAVDAYVPLTTEMMGILQTLRAGGLEQEDHSAIIKYYEKRTGVEVRKNRGMRS